MRHLDPAVACEDLRRKSIAFAEAVSQSIGLARLIDMREQDDMLIDGGESGEEERVQKQSLSGITVGMHEVLGREVAAIMEVLSEHALKLF